MARLLDAGELRYLLHLAVPIHLGTVDANGFPHVTPLWFEWHDGTFWMTSLVEKPHVHRLRLNPAASVCLDVEADEREDGQRPNMQVRAIGRADLLDDVGGYRTRRVTEKYLHGPGRDRTIARRTAAHRVVIGLRPDRLLAVASI